MEKLLLISLLVSMTSILTVTPESFQSMQFLEEGKKGELVCEAPYEIDSASWHGPQKSDERLCSGTAFSRDSLDCEGFVLNIQRNRSTLKFQNGPHKKDAGSYSCTLASNLLSNQPVEGTYNQDTY